MKAALAVFVACLAALPLAAADGRPLEVDAQPYVIDPTCGRCVGGSFSVTAGDLPDCADCYRVATWHEARATTSSARLQGNACQGGIAYSCSGSYFATLTRDGGTVGWCTGPNFGYKLVL